MGNVGYYIRDHNLKIQTDYKFRDEDSNSPKVVGDLYQLQFQLEF